MILISIWLAGCWLGWCLIQLGFALVFTKIVADAKELAENQNSELIEGHAAILLPVRGNDPSLGRCLESLLNQDYGDYKIYVIVDSEQDPAWQTISEIQKLEKAPSNLIAVSMPSPPTHRGLKCSALLHGLKQIETPPKYILFVDSDVVTKPDWLRKMLTPLSEQNVGVVTTSQWFDPKSLSLGASLRSLWQAGAIVPCAMYGNVWAGSTALRFADFQKAGIAERWESSVIDDGPVQVAIRELKLYTRFLPDLIVINSENCSLNYVNQYVRRMLTWARIYDPTFKITVVHALLTGLFLLGTVACLITAAVQSNAIAIIVATAGIVGGMMLNTIGYFLIRHPVASQQLEERKRLNRVFPVRMAMLFLLAPVAQLLYFKSLISALLAKRIRWRDVTYRLMQDQKVQMEGYQPFEGSRTERSII